MRRQRLRPLPNGNAKHVSAARFRWDFRERFGGCRNPGVSRTRPAAGGSESGSQAVSSARRTSRHGDLGDEVRTRSEFGLLPQAGSVLSFSFSWLRPLQADVEMEAAQGTVLESGPGLSGFGRLKPKQETETVGNGQVCGGTQCAGNGALSGGCWCKPR